MRIAHWTTYPGPETHPSYNGSQLRSGVRSKAPSFSTHPGMPQSRGMSHFPPSLAASRLICAPAPSRGDVMTALETTDAQSDPVAEQRDALLARLNDAMTTTFEFAAVYMGDRLGYYAAMAPGDPLTSTDLASRTGTNERYTREWLEEQAMAGFIDVDNP